MHATPRLRPVRLDDEAEFAAAHRAMAADDFEFGLGYSPGASWAEYVRRLADQRCGVNLAPGLVPATFLVADVGGVIVGRTSIRHELNEFLMQVGGHIGYGVLAEHRRRGYATEILRQSLVIARAVGVERVLVTCDEGNVGSATVIERCGGVYESSIDTERRHATEAALLDRLMDVPRRAIVVPVPPPVGRSVDEIRRRFDPVMAARIDAHITLVHEVVDHQRAAELVARAAERPPFTVHLTRAALWGPARYGVYLDVADPDGALASLHAALREVETPGWARVEYRPHVTLVHGRTVTADDAELAWSALDGFVAGWEVKVSSIDTIELVEPRWDLVERVEMGGAR